MNLFEEYLNNENLDKRERAKLWRTSIGLQAVDNLRVSNFLIEVILSSYLHTIIVAVSRADFNRLVLSVFFLKY